MVALQSCALCPPSPRRRGCSSGTTGSEAAAESRALERRGGSGATDRDAARQKAEAMGLSGWGWRTPRVAGPGTQRPRTA
ncbi:hypothetical protein P7K49_013352, partial [Saguinus oedipus]